MNTDELMLGNIVQGDSVCMVTRIEEKVVFVSDGYCTRPYLASDLYRIHISKTLLEKVGWERVSPNQLVYKKGSVRLGWIDESRFIIGYTEWPTPIFFLHQLQNILAQLGMNNMLKEITKAIFK